jgi:hypothetical protein
MLKTQQLWHIFFPHKNPSMSPLQFLGSPSDKVACVEDDKAYLSSSTQAPRV